MRDRVTEYAQSVVSGTYPHKVGKLHFLACERHLRDIARQGTDEFPFYWDVEAGNRVLEYAETLIIVEGAEQRQVQLFGFQIFDIGVRFGWKKLNGKRRFRRSYISMARQNGKTFLNGIVGPYIGGFCGYHYGKLFTVATKKRQAKLAWEEMAKFIQADNDLNELFTVKDYKQYIECKTTHCTIEALSREAGLDDGFRSIFSSIDEIHQHRDNKVYQAIYKGTRALPETLISMITTRGDRLNSFCKEMDDYCVGVLKGAFQADDLFVDIYALDKGDDMWDESNWVKSNPMLAQTEQGLESLRLEAETAKNMGGSDLRDFLIKALNLWVENTDDHFIETENWTQCASERTLEDFRGQSCWVGLDLSSGGDLTTIALEFETADDGAYWYSHSFMPRGRLEEHVESDLAPYDLWEQQGLLTVTGGASTYKNDYKFILKHLRELQDDYDLTFKGIGIDPHNADGILSDLEDFGCPVLLITQSARYLHDGTEDIQLMIKSHHMEYHKDNGLLTWSAVNAKIVRNSFGEKKIDKEPRARFKRIDPIDAGINAHVIRMKYQTKEVVDVQSAMESYLDKMGWS